MRWVRRGWLLAMSESPERSCISLRATWQSFAWIPSSVIHVCGGSFLLRNDRLWGPRGKAFFFQFPVVSPNIVYSQSHSRLVLTRRAGWVWSSVIPVRGKVKEHDVTVIFEQAAGRFQNVTVQPRYYLCHISCVWLTNASSFQQVKEDQERTEEIDAEWQVLSSALSCSHGLKPSLGFTVTPKSHLSSYCWFKHNLGPVFQPCLSLYFFRIMGI